MTGGFGSGGDSSADAELSTSLQRLRSRARQMVRDSSYAKRARMIVVNNVIGSGVGLQAQIDTNRAGPNGKLNSDVEAAYAEWCCAESCHTGGAMHFHDIERAAMAQVFDAGEIFIRKHYVALGDSRVPLSLELIEPERVPLDIVPPGVTSQSDVRMGIERDSFGRAVAYWIRKQHPFEVRVLNAATADLYERVLAEHIIHLRIIDRWPQTRGEPWLHTALRKLDELNEYTGLEVSAARGSAAYFATITTPEPENGLTTDEEEDGSQVMDLEPLTVQELRPGEELTFHTPNRPNTALDPFMRSMLREIAAGAGVSYESLSRDYSQSNYSSSRLALLDDRDTWRTLQQWWIRSFRMPLHKVWMRQAVYARVIPSISVEQFALNPAKYTAVVWKPRGWNWVDPTKEVKAYKEAIRAGLTSATDVVAATADGRDIGDIVRALQRERELFEEAGITVDTDVAAEMAAKSQQPGTNAPTPEDAEEVDEAAPASAAPRGLTPLRQVNAKGLMQ